jgi:hypothetical protein
MAVDLRREGMLIERRERSITQGEKDKAKYSVERRLFPLADDKQGSKTNLGAYPS